MRIVQISDSHIAHDIPQRLADLDACIDAVNQLPSPADVVIHTGDISHNGLAEEFNTARLSLDKLKYPYFVLAGNKDKRSPLKQAFADHSYLQQHADFIQYSIEQFATRLIILDTVCETDSKGELCDDRLQHIEHMLKQDTRKPALVFMHHSPFAVQEIPTPHQFHNWLQVEALDKLLRRHPNVQAVYCGHVHRNLEGSIGKLTVNVLSCMATDLRKGKLDDHEKTRPMYRVIDIA